MVAKKNSRNLILHTKDIADAMQFGEYVEATRYKESYWGAFKDHVVDRALSAQDTEANKINQPQYQTTTYKNGIIAYHLDCKSYDDLRYMLLAMQKAGVRGELKVKGWDSYKAVSIVIDEPMKSSPFYNPYSFIIKDDKIEVNLHQGHWTNPFTKRLLPELAGIERAHKYIITEE